ncbi:zinc-binding dehydrogenase [Paenibacillus sp. GCM10027626]|uniref:zinc-binding dehydrogenase n=1 Tax=Paenibacillus sp. GCM10027626 TaxID=3273411 RepID=UPI0036371882
MRTNEAVAITAYAQAECVEIGHCGEPAPYEVAGETMFSLISPGTELAACYFGSAPFPKIPGYAAVMKVTAIGAEVDHIKLGDYVYFSGQHKRYQKADRRAVLPLPAQLDPAFGAIARLMGVSMTTLITTAAKPGERVLIMGAGPVGYLAAHMFKGAGYRIAVCDPDPQRRQLLASTGITDVYEKLDSEAAPQGRDSFALAIDCSGHEGAVLDACRSVRKGGEVVMVGVPWKQQSEHTAHQLMHVVFHNYVHLRSGWEWELPIHAGDFSPHSIMGNWATALSWLNEGRIPLDGLIRTFAPCDAQEAYSSLAARTMSELFVMFDWRA